MSNLVVQDNISSLYPSVDEWKLMRDQADILLKSGFLPDSVKTPEQAVTIMLKGRELKMPAMQAFSTIHVIKGKPTLSAESMLAMILKNFPKTQLTYAQYDNRACHIQVTRPGNNPSEFMFTMDDAIQAGITGNPTWKKYPRAMLRSRCISEMARALFPDCLMGVSYTPEEIETIDVKVNQPSPVKIMPKMKAQDLISVIYQGTPVQKELSNSIFEALGFNKDQKIKAHQYLVEHKIEANESSIKKALGILMAS